MATNHEIILLLMIPVSNIFFQIRPISTENQKTKEANLGGVEIMKGKMKTSPWKRNVSAAKGMCYNPRK